MNKDDEIENILRENPIESEPKIQTYSKAKKPEILKKILSKKKIIIYVGIAALAVFTIFMLFQLNKCETCAICDVCTQDISLEDIKQQIITKGYADVDGLKLSPYTK